MEDNKKDLKEGEESTPTGGDQPAKDSTGSDDEGKGTSSALDSLDDQEKISTSELKDLRKKAKDGENYRKAFLKDIKGKGRNLPGSELVKKKVEEDPFDDGESKFVTKQELAKHDEDLAVRNACKNEEVLINWADIIVFYQRPRENTYETQSAAIQSAYKLWKANEGDNTVEEDKKKASKAKQDLSSEKSLNTGKDKKPDSPRKIIIPKRQKMVDWYGKQK